MRRFLNLAFVAVLIGCAGCTGAAATAPTTTASAARQPGQDVGTALDAALPSHILELPFTASDGRTVRLQDFAGKVVAVSDVMTLCQETCPMDTATFVDTDRAEQTAGLGGDEIFLSITVDPGRDTRAQLAAYRDLFAPPQNWLALTGPPTSVDALWNYLGVGVNASASRRARRRTIGGPDAH